MTVPPPSALPLQPGDTLLGKYRVDRVLGKGGMGMVVAAQHLHLGGLFAIKIMLPEMLDNPEAIGRFLREAQASSRLRSEHVARVHDVGTLETGVPYMVLEYLEGQDLDRELMSRGVLGVGQAAAYVAQVAEALIEAHAQGIVHRDLKPANLFLTRRANGSSCIKVLDFGISKDITAGNQGAQKLTQTGSIMGSPHYMSPEQLIDSKNVDPRSDIWALGIILYELVTGMMPFNAETMPEIVAKVLSTQPTPLRTLRPDIPPEFEAIVQRCTEKERDKRFSSAGEFLAALRPFIREGDAVPAGAMADVRMGGPARGAQSDTAWDKETIAAKSAPSLTKAVAPGRKWMMIVAFGAVAMLGLVALVFLGSSSGETKEPIMPVSSVERTRQTAEGASNTPESPTAARSIPVQAASSSGANTSPPAKDGPVTTVKTSPPVTTASAPASATTSTKKKKVKGFDE